MTNEEWNLICNEVCRQIEKENNLTTESAYPIAEAWMEEHYQE